MVGVEVKVGESWCWRLVGFFVLGVEHIPFRFLWKTSY